uniref:Uncharacterized protein n=1 Tax=Arundo donax TaxID=35708 RepID=A0A0A9E603_ARUDO
MIVIHCQPTLGVSSQKLWTGLPVVLCSSSLVLILNFLTSSCRDARSSFFLS